MEIEGQLEATGWGGQDYSSLVKDFSPELIEDLQKRFPDALMELINNENGERLFADPSHIFDYEDWRFYIHRCTTENEFGLENEGDEVISVLAYNVNFDVVPITLQVNHVCLLLEEISSGKLGKGEIIRSMPGHVALMFPGLNNLEK